MKRKGLNKVQRHPKNSVATLRKGAPKSGSGGPHPGHPPAGKLPAKTMGTDA